MIKRNFLIQTVEIVCFLATSRSDVTAKTMVTIVSTFIFYWSIYLLKKQIHDRDKIFLLDLLHALDQSWPSFTQGNLRPLRIDWAVLRSTRVVMPSFRGWNFSRGTHRPLHVYFFFHADDLDFNFLSICCGNHLFPFFHPLQISSIFLMKAAH